MSENLYTKICPTPVRCSHCRGSIHCQPSSAVIPGPRDSSPDRAQPAGIQLPARPEIQACSSNQLR
ncbi:hypothetical protein TIFTF001_016975 [Ficus carica]|uniref:Uncharacterized protein n=1 Tax=Ficus carica TaxID=3494 RepID=A0AA88D7U5_FICCA|nr:hypothetical protein TIFTF001_016975 [Ficus carica]